MYLVLRRACGADAVPVRLGFSAMRSGIATTSWTSLSLWPEHWRTENFVNVLEATDYPESVLEFRPASRR